MKYKVEHAFHLIFIIQEVMMILTKNIFQLFKYQNVKYKYIFFFCKIIITWIKYNNKIFKSIIILILFF